MRNLPLRRLRELCKMAPQGSSIIHIGMGKYPTSLHGKGQALPLWGGSGQSWAGGKAPGVLLHPWNVISGQSEYGWGVSRQSPHDWHDPTSPF